jgi:predicted RNA-binding protein (TIGR00451 family)
MALKLPLISEEMKKYLLELLGKDRSSKFLQKIVTPTEDYSLHIYQEVSIVDKILDLLHKNNFSAKIHDIFPNLIICTPKGKFKLKSTEHLKEIIVDNQAAEMIYQGADVFVPGVKRANRIKKNDVVKIVNQQGITVAKAKALMSHHEMLNKKKGIAAKNLVSPYRVPSLEQFGLKDYPVFFQSIPAFLTSMNLEPKSNETILDCCAAPGNKTLHLSELLGNKSKIVAVDRSEKRLQKLRNRIEQFKIKNVSIKIGNIIDFSETWTVKFDKILIDPPCSSLGLRPRLVFNTSIKKIKDLSKYQNAIIYACNSLLKSGGTIVYSTCTITKEENEEIICKFAENYNLRIIEQQYNLSKIGSILEKYDFPFQRFLPGMDNTLGYFIAKLRKK